jgi:peptidyl-prolyl cis-trans isomerase B (cyclophilin B)
MRNRSIFPALLQLAFLGAAGSFAKAEEVAFFQFEKKGVLLPPVVIGLHEADAPRHVTNFKQLVARGFYKKTGIHRVVAGRLLQMGDPLSRLKNSPDIGTGGPGYTVAPEISRRHAEGSVAMGRLPDRINPSRVSNGSQFYVSLRALPELDGTDTVFGSVEAGLDVLVELGNVPVDRNEMPEEPVIIRRARLVQRENADRELALWGRDAKKEPSWWKRNVARWWPF